jgi:hypothetical protein
MSDEDYIKVLAEAFQGVANAIKETNKDFKFTARAGIAMLIACMCLLAFGIVIVVWNAETRLRNDLSAMKEGLRIDQTVILDRVRSHDDNVRDELERIRKARGVK